MLTFTVFDILLLENRSVLSPAQWDTASERVKFSIKKPKKCLTFVELA